MKLKIYQIDAFAGRVFEGNPAAVCPLEAWLPDGVMQSIAMENQLSETAFFVRSGDGYEIRWFTPTREVDLCGHATLASAHVLFEHLGCGESVLSFRSKSGELRVSRDRGLLVMDFPAHVPEACDMPPGLSDAFGVRPVSCLKREDYIVVFGSEEEVRAAAPDLSLLREVDLRGVVITSRARSYDFVVRFFAPKYGIDEDPVTGSAFTQLTPYWSGVLGKTELKAKQVSRRGGEVLCGLSGDRVNISGGAVTYMVGTIEIYKD